MFRASTNTKYSKQSQAIKKETYQITIKAT